MKISILIIGVILFFLGAFTKVKIFIAAGMILIIMSFFGKILKRKETGKEEGEEKKELPKQKGLIRTKRLCSSCGAEILHGDNYCPECGKKVLP